jgi:hypothetical protein
MSRWSQVIGARNSLEHFDDKGTGARIPTVPMHSSDGKWQFLTPESPVDVEELFKSAERLCKAICEVIQPFEA